MPSITDLFIKIALMLALGFVLRKTGVITANLQQGLSDLLLKAFLPASILASTNVTLNPSIRQGMLGTALAAGGYYVAATLAAWLLSRALRLPSRRRNVFIAMSVFANTGFMGFPIVQELFGDEGMLYAVIYNLFFNLFFFTLGVYLLEGGSEKKFHLRRLYTNVTTIVSLAAIALTLSPLRFPEPVVSTLSTVGSVTVPLSMIIIGSSLATIKLRSVLVGVHSYIVTALRLLVFPVLMMLALKWLALPLTFKMTCVLMTALPCGALNVIYAERNGCEPEYAVRTVVQTMLLMLVSIPAILALGNFVFA